MGDMTRDEIDARFAAIQTQLDNRFAAMTAELRLEIQKNSSDMQKVATDIIKWVVGMIVGASAVALTVMTFVLNNAIPKTPVPAPLAAPASITVNIPSHPSPLPAAK
jgi:hypothetical protein